MKRFIIGFIVGVTLTWGFAEWAFSEVMKPTNWAIYDGKMTFEPDPFWNPGENWNLTQEDIDLLSHTEGPQWGEDQ